MEAIAVLERPKRLKCGNELAEAADHARKHITNKGLRQLLLRLAAYWRLIETLNNKSDAYELVLETGNNLYVVLAVSVNRFTVPRRDRDFITLAMSKWLETLTFEESIDVLTRAKRLSA